MLTRVRAVVDPPESPDPEYAAGMRAAVEAALEHGLDALDGEAGVGSPAPAPLLRQCRIAARNGVGLEAVLRQCSAGYTVFNAYLLDEAARLGTFGTNALQGLIQAEGKEFERLLATVGEEHGRELHDRSSSPDSQRAKRLERLLAGELVDLSRFQYDFDSTHVGVISVGSDASAAVDVLAKALGYELLRVGRGEAVWAWFGARAGAEPARLGEVISSRWPSRLPLAVGEPAQGLAGWRLTHRQARAAFSIALRGPDPIACYGDVALLASAFQDDLLTASLRQLYLAPLERERDGGEVLRRTLRAYFGTGRNISAAASALGANRNTVTNRLRAAEAKIGRPLTSCATELDTALRLSEIGAAAALSSRRGSCP